MAGVRSAVRQVPGPCSHWDDDDADFIRHILDRVGDKWSVLVVGTLEAGPVRYTELAHAIPGISQRMLTLTLQHLAEDGLVTRTSFPEVPPRVEYELTTARAQPAENRPRPRRLGRGQPSDHSRPSDRRHSGRDRRGKVLAMMVALMRTQCERTRPSRCGHPPPDAQPRYALLP